VVSPGTTLYPGDVFTVSFTLSLNGLTSVLLTGTDVTEVSLVPAVSPGDTLECDARPRFAVLMGSGTCVVTWTFAVPGDTASGDYETRFTATVGSGDPGSDVGKAVTVTVLPPTPTVTATSTPAESPTPAPTPEMFLTIARSSQPRISLPYDIRSIRFEVPDVPEGSVEIYVSQRSDCHMVDGLSFSFSVPEGGVISKPIDLFYLLGSNNRDDPGSVSIYAERSTDGAKTSCRILNIFRTDEPGPPIPPVTQPPPSATPTVPPSSPLPATATATAAATARPSLAVTSLPQTGAGSGSAPALPAVLLGIAMALLLTALGIDRRRKHWRSER
jgi:hypothetical protein